MVFLLSAIILSHLYLPFRSNFDPREINIDYIILERARITGQVHLNTTIKPVLTGDLKFKTASPESAYFYGAGNPNLYLKIRLRDWGYLSRFTPQAHTSLNESENYMHLCGEAYLRRGNFEILHSSAVFSEERNHRFDLAYYDPLLNPDFRLYTFDVAPPIGHSYKFDVRTDAAYLHFANRWIDFSAGRLPVRLGPGFRSSLFLSGYALPLKYIYNFRVRKDWLEFMAAYATFPDTLKWKRMAYQRLVLSPFDFLEIGFNQGAIWVDSDPFKYFDPVDFYYIVQRRGRDNSDNLIGGADISIYLFNKIKVYSEFFDDDFIITGGSPSKYGIMAGTHIVDPFGVAGSDLIVEFTHVNPWTYPHYYSDYRSNPEILGYPIGFWAGPACNVLTLDFIKFTKISSGFARGFRIGYEYLQHADQDMRDGWGGHMSMTPPPYNFDVRNSLRVIAFQKSNRFSYEAGAEVSFMSGESLKGSRVTLRFNVEGVPFILDFTKLFSSISSR